MFAKLTSMLRLGPTARPLNGCGEVSYIAAWTGRVAAPRRARIMTDDVTSFFMVTLLSRGSGSIACASEAIRGGGRSRGMENGSSRSFTPGG
jgi:hypothetical protein